MLRAFRYSGSKHRYLDFYRLPQNYKRLVEPFAGSMAMSINSSQPALGIELNSDVVACWHWLQKVEAHQLLSIANSVEDLKRRETKPDARLLGLCKGAETWVRLNITGLVVGQLSSWRIYPQHQLPTQQTIDALPRIRSIEIRHGSATDYIPSDGDVLFVDPPYLGTTGNYINKSNGNNLDQQFNPNSIRTWLASIRVPMVITYGTSAMVDLPEYQWQLVAMRRVPNVRKGGTVNRCEYVAYVNC